MATDSRVIVELVPLIVLLTLVCWVLATVAVSTGQWGDHLEQFVWAHGVQWGYHKHPPLPTWLLAATISAFGPSIYWADALALVCLMGAALFTYGVARELFGREVAALALLLLSLMHAYSGRASLFNHNSVMLLTVSGAAWCVLGALKPDGSWSMWLLAAVAAALAILSKYQAVVPLAGIVLAAALTGELAPPRARRGLAAAVAVALVLLAPHLIWLYGHGAALGYATQQGRSLTGAERAWNVVSFLVQQLRYLIGPLLLFGLLSLLPGPRTDRIAGQTRRQRAWLVGLVAFPFWATVLTGPLFGIELQNHWGYQALQFVTLWLAWRLRPLAPVASGSWIAVALAIHGVLLAIALADPDIHTGKAVRVDGNYPAQALADAVAADWKDDSLCPLRLVVGPSFEAGIVSVYGGGTARVLEDGSYAKSPWIAPAEVTRHGAVYVASDPAKLPTKGVTKVNWMDAGGSAQSPRRIYWAIAPPERCSE